MNIAVTRFLARLRKRLAPFFDMTAWVLLIASIVPLLLIDPAMVVTLAQWTAFALALAGITVVITRVVLPQVDLTEWLAHAREGSVAGGLVVLAVSLTVCFTFLGLVLWAKA
ncbi:hypothetical protein [Pseudomonas phage Rocky]